MPGPDPDEVEEDMAAKGLVLHLAITLDVVLLVAAPEVRDGVIIAPLLSLTEERAYTALQSTKTVELDFDLCILFLTETECRL